MYHLGWGYISEEIAQREGYKLMPSDNSFGQQSLGPTLQMIQPEFLITQADTRMLSWMSQIKLQIPWLFYCVNDGHVWDYENKQTKWPSTWVALEKMADIVVGMSKWGENIFKNNGLNTAYVPHGVDTNSFRPVDDNIKNQLRTQAGIGSKDFVVGYVAKNISRKYPDKNLQAWKIFLEDYLDQSEREKAMLVMHTPPDAQWGGEFQLPHLVSDYGLELSKNVVFSNPSAAFIQMPQIFNLFDVTMLLVGGEAFCVPFIESMSSGIPVLTTDYSTGPEIIGDNKAGLLVDVPTYKNKKVPVTMGSYEGVEFGLPDIYDAAEKLNKLYEHPEFRKELGFNGTVAATKLYDWSVVVPQWNEVINNTVGVMPDQWKEALAL
jgi:glycosyltransferase involved in cell wall biosynthesis